LSNIKLTLELYFIDNQCFVYYKPVRVYAFTSSVLLECDGQLDVLGYEKLRFL